MKIESIRLKNFRMFRDVTINKLPNYCVFVGANGTGKTSFFDLFGFLRDALTYNVKQALAKRGGFFDVVSRGTSGPIELELKFRDLKSTSSIVTYHLIIDQISNQPVVKREVLKYCSKQDGGKLIHFLDFSLGQGKVISNAQEKPQEQKLVSSDILALNGLGQLQQFEVASELRNFLENWHFSDFQLSEVRKINHAVGYDERLSSSGDNLALFALAMYNNYPETYNKIMIEMARRVPELAKIEPITEKGRIFLEFYNHGFKEPFLSWQVSDGTIQLFAYMLLLYDPNQHSLLCVEEPEKQIYPHILREFSEEFSLYAIMGEGQVFVSTHSPDFLNGAELTEIFWLTKQDGYTQIHRAADSKLLQGFFEDGELSGALWKQGLLEDADLL